MAKAGEIIAASDVPSEDAYTPYTPLWTANAVNPSIGNGSVQGWWTRMGRTIFFRIIVVAGSTTTYGSGIYLFSLPVPIAASAVSAPVGQAAIIDSSAAARFQRGATPNSATNVFLVTENGVYVQHNLPVAWATGDSFAIAGSYEAAS